MEARASEAFVGRVRELAALQRALDATLAGGGTTVLVAGEAGIGKSRLASELAEQARAAGFEVLIGRSIDLVGTELPYQPFVEALRPLGAHRRAQAPTAGSQLQVFEETLALLTEHAAPVVLVLEDLHWADTSTLDLVVYLAHNLDGRVLLLATYRADEPASAERMRRLADGVRRTGPAIVLELGPLDDEELTALLTARTDGSLPASVSDAIVARCEGNPFFAEELLAAGEHDERLPRGLRDLLLERFAGLDRRTQGLLHLAAAAGREVGYPLLQAVAVRPEHEVRESLRRAVERGVLVTDQATARFRFRHALVAEAIYATILPGEREEIHALLAAELARAGAAAGEVAPHWAAAARAPEALVASVEAAREAEAVFGLAEANAHLVRAVALWEAVADAAELTGLDLAALCSWAAELASRTGAAPGAVDLTRRAIELVGEGNPLRLALLHERLARYLHESGRTDAALAACQRVVELVPSRPPSPERARALAVLADGLMLAWRFDESLAVGEQALALADAVGATPVGLEVRLDLGRDLAYLGRGDEGVTLIWQALGLAEEAGDPVALLHAYVSLTDVLTMLGRPAESARLADVGLDAVRRYAIDATVLVANQIEALLAIGAWDRADEVSAVALRAITANFPYMLLIIRADLEIGRGDFDAARTHLEGAAVTLREDHGLGVYDVYLADLALWERRWREADDAVHTGLARAGVRHAAQIRVWLCAKGLRAQAELAALARARRDADALQGWLDRASTLIGTARGAAAEATAVTSTAAGWLALAEAEYQRCSGEAQPESWAAAALAWERSERPPLAAYCRWRQAEALVAAGAPRADAAVPLRAANAVAARIGARPLLYELELLAQRARIEVAPPEAVSPDERHDLQANLGLTARESEVLALVGRGCTNREIAAELVISVKTASVHVSHILRKLGVPNRGEAAAIAHRLAQPDEGRSRVDG